MILGIYDLAKMFPNYKDNQFCEIWLSDTNNILLQLRNLQEERFQNSKTPKPNSVKTVSVSCELHHAAVGEAADIFIRIASPW